MFQLASDLHLEFYEDVILDDFIIPSSDILLLAGDIGYPSTDTYKSFLQQCNTKFKKTILIAGNHEFYNNTFDGCIQKIQNDVEGLDNVVFLNDDKIVIEIEEKKFTILGSTLWSEIPNDEKYFVKNSLNDYRKICSSEATLATPDDINKRYYNHLEWLEQQIKTSGENVIVMTHHLPSFQLIHEMYKSYPGNCAFANQLDDLITSPVTLWCCGHTHKYTQQTINNIPCIINPYGYPWEETEYKKDCLVTPYLQK